VSDIQQAAALPRPLSSFLGRDEELAAIDRLLASTRLLTLTGPGGVGKTRLALQAAAQTDRPAVFVDLATLRDPRLLLPTLATALGLRSESAASSPPDHLAEQLGARPLLLVLDNFEQVVDAAPELAELLTFAPGLTALVTSRVPLRIAGEQEFPVGPLPLAPDTAGLSAAEALRSPAVRLFLQRAQAVRPSFALDDGAAPTVAAICARLDGLPLALELAAARMRVLSLSELRERLNTRLPLLAGGLRDAPSRHRTLRDTIAWSEELLAEPARRLLRRLAVFPAGATAEMALAVCLEAGVDEVATLELLTALTEHQLVLPREGAGPTRYVMLETVREYATERLATSGEEPEVRRRAWTCLAELAQRASDGWRSSSFTGLLPRLDAEHDNFRAALSYALDTGDSLAAYRLGGALWRYWHTRAHAAEGHHWLARIMGLPPPDNADGGQSEGGARLRAELLFGAAANAAQRGDQQGCTVLGQQALEIFQRIGDEDGTALALLAFGSLANDYGEYNRAAVLLTEALEIRRRRGPAGLLALVLVSLGTTRLFQSRYAEAYGLFAESLAIQRESDDQIGIAESLLGMGTVAGRLGDLARARSLLRESIDRAHRLGVPLIVSLGLDSLAWVYTQEGESRQALQLLSASEAIRRRQGVMLIPSLHAHVVELVLAARARLGAEWVEVWESGRQLSAEEALSLLPAAKTTRPTIVAPQPPLLVNDAESLTAREAEVLQLVALGITNKEIAERLVVSAGTVHTHLKSIFGKLGVATRAAATRAAIERGLVRMEPPAP
jgi:predicted ATPase/DNA-binding CsgD family transcriptional regulator